MGGYPESMIVNAWCLAGKIVEQTPVRPFRSPPLIKKHVVDAHLHMNITYFKILIILGHIVTLRRFCSVIPRVERV
jgi:hypothetical protein